MESVVIGVLGERCDLECEVNKALLAELVNDRIAVSAEFQVHDGVQFPLCALIA